MFKLVTYFQTLLELKKEHARDGLRKEIILSEDEEDGKKVSQLQKLSHLSRIVIKLASVLYFDRPVPGLISFLIYGYKLPQFSRHGGILNCIYESG